MLNALGPAWPRSSLSSLAVWPVFCHTPYSVLKFHCTPWPKESPASSGRVVEGVGGDAWESPEFRNFRASLLSSCLWLSPSLPYWLRFCFLSFHAPRTRRVQRNAL